MNVTFCTPRGGKAPIDPCSLKEAEKDEIAREFLQNRSIIDRFQETQSIHDILSRIKESETNACMFGWVFLPGCHGAMMDLPACHEVGCVIAAVYEGKMSHQPGNPSRPGHPAPGHPGRREDEGRYGPGYIAAIGHGTAGLLNAKLSTGEYLVAHKKVTCFSDKEEKELGYAGKIPYSLQSKLKERGAEVELAEPFKPKVVVAERLITAQSPYSLQEWVKCISEVAMKHQ